MKQSISEWFKSHFGIVTNKDLMNKLNKIMTTEQDILDTVTAQTTVIQSAITLLNQLSKLLHEAGTDPVKLQAIKDMLDNNSKGLSDAVVANTPAQ